MYTEYEPTNSCCGITEINHLAIDPEAQVRDFCEYFCNGAGNIDPNPLVLFTDAAKNKRGTKLAAYLKKHKLGKVIASPKAENPCTNNIIQGWFWKVNLGRLNTWAEKHGIK